MQSRVKDCYLLAELKSTHIAAQAKVLAVKAVPVHAKDTGPQLPTYMLPSQEAVAVHRTTETTESRRITRWGKCVMPRPRDRRRFLICFQGARCRGSSKESPRSANVTIIITQKGQTVSSLRIRNANFLSMVRSKICTRLKVFVLELSHTSQRSESVSIKIHVQNVKLTSA